MSYIPNGSNTGEMSRLVFRASWGEEVSSPRVGLHSRITESVLPSPSPPHVFILVFGVSLSLLDYRTSFFYGAHPLVMDA